MRKNKFYVTTPIYYVTAKPHLGSLYSTLLADVSARWKRLQGKKVFFLTGTDEHGLKVVQASEKSGKKTMEFIDGLIRSYKDIWRKYELEYDDFIRTTDERHIKAVRYWIKVLEQKGDIYKDYYKGWYCTPCETFVAEKDFNENEGIPLCVSCGRKTNKVAEESYFFKLSKYQDRLLDFYKKNPGFVIPKERLPEVVNFVKSGLKDLCISRTTVKWGIPFPKDEKHTVYVWADALLNYISAIGYSQEERKEVFDFWWPADLQILGKDIFKFHAVYWPAFLMAAGLALPKKLLVHGWIKVNNQKMSKSLGNIVDPDFLYQRYGAEAVRYYLVKYIAITQDGEFSIKDLENKISSDLANSLGNLVNRMLMLADKNNLKKIHPIKQWTESSVKLHESYKSTVDTYIDFMNNSYYHMALGELWKFISLINAYFHSQKPWQMAVKDQAGFIETISAVCHCLRAVAYLAWPVMPKKMESLLKTLGIEFILAEDQIDEIKTSKWDKSFNLKSAPILFKKPAIFKQDIKEEETIDISDFSKVKLVVGTIEKCEEIAKSDRLLKLRVNFGERGLRQIIAGIKQYYSPEDLIGKQGVFVFNLKPRKIMGLESQGMMLFAKDKNGNLKFVTILDKVPNGSVLG